MKPLLLNPRDVITVTNVHTGKTESHRVEGVYLGAVGVDSLVELRPITKARGSVGPNPQNAFVPLVMLEAGVNSGIFTVNT